MAPKADYRKGPPRARALTEEHARNPTSDVDLKENVEKITSPVSNRDKKKRKFDKKKKSISPTKTDNLITPMSSSVPILEEFLKLSMNPSPKRHAVPYFPDLQGLGDVAMHVWEVYRTRKITSSVVKDFHYIMFIEEVMRVATLYIIFCMNMVSSSDPVWNDPWLMQECLNLQGIPIPKFLSVFLYQVGSFTGANGSDFYWCAPPGLDEQLDAGCVVLNYATAFPSFKHYRRIVDNLVHDREWWLFTPNRAIEGPGNDSVFTEEESRAMPGLRDAVPRLNKYIKDALHNMTFEYDVEHDEDYNARYFFQGKATGYENYRRRIFPRMQEDGLPSTILELPKAQPLGTMVPNFLAYPNKDEEDEKLPENYFLSTAMHKYDEVLMHVSALFRPSIVKTDGQVIFAGEIFDGRFDAELSATTLTTNVYNMNFATRGYASKVFSSTQ